MLFNNNGEKTRQGTRDRGRGRVCAFMQPAVDSIQPLADYMRPVVDYIHAFSVICFARQERWFYEGFYAKFLMSKHKLQKVLDK